MEGHGAGDRGDPHPVAVVANAGHDPREEPLGRDHPGREIGRRRVRGCNAEDVEVGNRLRPEAGAEDIADHPAEASGSTAVWLDRRGMIVSLDLDADVVIAVEADDAGVVAEHAHAPVAPAERLTDLARRGKHRLFQEVVIADGAVGPLVVDRAAEGFVAAVLAPGLGDRLELDLERRPAERGEVIAHGAELKGGKGQTALAAQLRQRRVVEPVEGNRDLGERPGATTGEGPQRQRTDNDVVDRLAGQQLPGEPLGLVVGESGKPVFPHAPHGRRLEPEQPQRRQDALRRRVGHPRLGENMEDQREAGGGGWTGGIGGRRRGAGELEDRELLRDRIGQERRRDPFDVAPRQLPFDDPAGHGARRRACGDAEIGGARHHRTGGVVVGGIGGEDVNFPQHHGVPWPFEGDRGGFCDRRLRAPRRGGRRSGGLGSGPA